MFECFMLLCFGYVLILAAFCAKDFDAKRRERKHIQKRLERFF